VTGIIFDMDGLLIDTERMALKAWEGILEERGLPYNESVFLSMIGRPLNQCREILAEYLGSPHEAYQLWEVADKAYHRMLEEDIPLKPGALEILKWISQEKIPLGLATSTGKKTAQKKLAKAGLAQFFDFIICGDQVERGKPHPEIYLTAAEALGVNPEESYVFEDSYAGIEAAFAGGFKAIMVPDLLPPTEGILKKTLHQVDNLFEGLQLIQGLFNSDVTRNGSTQDSYRS